MESEHWQSMPKETQNQQSAMSKRRSDQSEMFGVWHAGVRAAFGRVSPHHRTGVCQPPAAHPQKVVVVAALVETLVASEPRIAQQDVVDNQHTPLRGPDGWVIAAEDKANLLADVFDFIMQATRQTTGITDRRTHGSVAIVVDDSHAMGPQIFETHRR